MNIKVVDKSSLLNLATVLTNDGKSLFLCTGGGRSEKNDGNKVREVNNPISRHVISCHQRRATIFGWSVGPGDGGYVKHTAYSMSFAIVTL